MEKEEKKETWVRSLTLFLRLFLRSSSSPFLWVHLARSTASRLARHLHENDILVRQACRRARAEQLDGMSGQRLLAQLAISRACLVVARGLADDSPDVPIYPSDAAVSFSTSSRCTNKNHICLHIAVYDKVSTFLAIPTLSRNAEVY